jgi:hypothetical protein
MTDDTLSGRKHYKLGILALVAEASVPADRYEHWLPRTGDAGGDPPAAALWLGGTADRDSLGAMARLVPGGVALWIDESLRRAALLSPAGHAELDLGDRWGRVCPRDGTGDIAALLTVGSALLMGCAGAALMDASGVIDSGGGGWLIVGPREERSKLVRAFVRDGCHYVSDDQVVVRGAHHQTGLVIFESWHRPVDDAAQTAGSPGLPSERWKSVAQLRGILLARSLVSRTVLPWRAATREQALASLIDASPHIDSDPVTTDPLRELLALCAARPAIVALLNRERELSPGSVLRQLASAMDAMI